MNVPRKVAITGAHSTGKSTFLDGLEARLGGRGLRVGRVQGLAKRARALGFPILTEHTIESTLWLMAEGLRIEAELSLSCDVILVDRPPLDALAYLHAALEISNRVIDNKRLSRLNSLARASTEDYDMLVVTTLDVTVPLGVGRDSNVAFRQAADAQVAALVKSFAPAALRLSRGEEATALAAVELAIT